MYWHCRKHDTNQGVRQFAWPFFAVAFPADGEQITAWLSRIRQIPEITVEKNELQATNTAWQIAMQEILRMVVRDIYKTGGEASFKAHIKRIEEAAVDSIYTGLMLRGTDGWTETLVKEQASNFVTTLLTSFTFDRA